MVSRPKLCWMVGRGFEWCCVFVMKIISWNVRGLGSLEKRREVRHLVRQKNLFIFLRYSVDKHPMPSNSSEIVVAPGLYSFCNHLSSK